MAEVANPNLPTSGVVAVADPNVEGVVSGMIAGSCSPGIGVSTGIINPKGEDWDRVTKVLQDQPLGWGGDSAVTGQETADIPDSHTVNYGAADFNNTPVTFVIANTQAAPNAVYDSISGAINRTDQTVEIGDWLWGPVPVA
jgi:hypothetical protein